MNHCLKLLVFFSILFLFGCGPNYIFDEGHVIENAEWTYQDTLNCKVDIQDSLKIYNLLLDIEHSTEFSNQNMYVMIHTLFPTGERLSERVSLEIASKAGVWFGDCDSEWCNFTIPIQQGAYFNATGKYVFTIEQFMRVNPLPGIKSIGLKIEDTGQQR